MKVRLAACLTLLLPLAPLLAAPGGFLGVYLSEGGEGDKGALVEEIAPGSPAASAGLRKGDQILSANGTKTRTSKALIDLLVQASPGTTLDLVVDRDGWTKPIKVELAGRPTAAAPPEPGTDGPRPAQPGPRGFLGVFFKENARGQPVISSVVEGSPAAAAGLRENDVIKTFDGKPVTEPSAVIAALAGQAPGSTVALGIERGGRAMEVKVVLGRKGMEAAPPRPAAEPARPREPDPKARKPGYLGVALDDAGGALKVDDVAANSPAERFGLLKGDVILAVGEQQVKTVEQFAKVMEPKLAGEVAVIKIERDGWKNDVRVTLGERQ